MNLKMYILTLTKWKYTLDSKKIKELIIYLSYGFSHLLVCLYNIACECMTTV